MATTMKAWKYATTTSIVLKEDAIAPLQSALSKHQLLVEVITAALNPLDHKILGGWLVRKLLMEKNGSPGLDFCGRVVEKHSTNSTHTKGELVFGSLPMISTYGTLGQYIVVSTTACAPLPEGIDPDHAAALGCAMGTAMRALDAGTVKPGSKVFINGGSGGVGTWAIQIAKALGAHVTTTCSTTNTELCRQVGADEVLDYRTLAIIPELKKMGQVFDLAIDNVGSDALYNSCDTFLKSTGCFAQVAATSSIHNISMIVWRTICCHLPTPRRRTFHLVVVKAKTEDYSQLARWILDGKVKAVIDSTFEFEDAPKAFEKLQTGHAKGKIIVHGSKK
ncbi:hypothetical protein BJ875DRAFT_477048 [Amylocarpus encephaloides]|uniref:Enoyl reductase (ER) domain-containing protein n=1 Tax=Amylocarpus encephaloides TaxID=45428 RepID=A0A9P7Y8I9_9HELO|nr:hypothetical protein BJ875DRAFT_477048 [Amylocarpus encephaloides]